jgi:hypothetical protein
MRVTRTALLILSLSCASLAGTAADEGSAGFVRLSPEQVLWQSIPDAHGAQLATLAGDPARPGIYVQRVRFPPHVMDHSHWHPNDRYVTVLKGTWYTGTGTAFDPTKAVPLGPGSYMLHPGHAVHWDGSNSDQEVIVQIVGLGPADTVQSDPNLPFWVLLKP